MESDWLSQKESVPESVALQCTTPPEEVVKGFCDHFFYFHQDDEGSSSRKAYDFLSSRVQSSLGEVRTGHFNRLLIFSGESEIPEHGYFITGIIERTDEEALVETIWNYNQAAQVPSAYIKTFALVKEQQCWKIDNIR